MSSGPRWIRQGQFDHTVSLRPARPGDRPSGYRRLVTGIHLWRRHRQAVGLGVLAVTVALACVALGRWQWSRYQEKDQRKQLIERNFAAPVVPLAAVVPSPRSALARDDEWRPVRLSGRYAVDRTVLVRNRPRDVGDTAPAYGYEVLVPLVLDDGSALLVDRGWVPSGMTGPNPAQAPDAVPPPAAGRVAVVVRLRPSEPVRQARTSAGQVGSIAVDQVAASTGLALYRPYGVLVSESPTSVPAPALIGKPALDGGEGINASYAVQWLVFAALALGLPIWWRWRLRRQRAAEAAETAALTEPTAGAPPPDGVDGATAARRTPVAATARKRRIWDDEDE